MTEKEFVKILEKIKYYVEQDNLEIARNLTRLEIQNFRDLVPKKCKYTIINDWTCCNNCDNYNCRYNRKEWVNKYY